MATVPHEAAALPPAVDLEFSGNSKARPTPAQFQRELEVFLDRLEHAYQTRPVIYTTYDFYAAYLQGLPLERLWVREVLMAQRAASSVTAGPFGSTVLGAGWPASAAGLT